VARTARRHGLQVLWTLMHYGVPPDLSLLDDALIPRFARFAAEAARALKPLSPGPRVYTPINEISFLAWAASSTNAMGPAGAHPEDAGKEDSRISGYEIKRRLVRAALAGIAAIRDVDPQARFLHIDPVIHVVPSDEAPEHRELATRIASYQWQAFDMLAGMQEPELGGSMAALDWVGLNHYHSSQWEVPSEKRLAWHLGDPRRAPLSELLGLVWERYRRPLIVAETGHVGRGRADWLNDIAGEARRAIEQGVPLAGVCLYPMLDRPDWHEPERWHRSGLWHVPRDAHGRPVGRRLVRPYARALAAWSRAFHLRRPLALTPTLSRKRARG
jgi:beta-glucosidase/6-phospho-beta-glucosidase/beta-galactosidase